MEELFGQSDELQSLLFASEIVQPQTASTVSVCHAGHPLPLLATETRSGVTEAPSTNHTPQHSLVRSTSVDNLLLEPLTDCQRHKTPGVQSHSKHVDICELPSEMPIYLLQEDEGNDEEIMRLLETTPTLNSSYDINEQSHDSVKRPSHFQATELQPDMNANKCSKKMKRKTLDLSNHTNRAKSAPACTEHSIEVPATERTLTSHSPTERTHIETHIEHAHTVPLNKDKVCDVVIAEITFDLNHSVPPSEQYSASEILTNRHDVEDTSVSDSLNGGQFALLNHKLNSWSLKPVIEPEKASSVRDRKRKLCSEYKKKRKHGGGWPKGKSRKVGNELAPPKPPASGYTLFLSEHRGQVKEKCEGGDCSMAQLSRKLGKMWSELDHGEKEKYYSKAKEDRIRYLRDLRLYIAETHKGFSLEGVEQFLSQSFACESDDKILVCQNCKISFSSLYNKHCHFSGKLHMNTLLEELKNMCSAKQLYATPHDNHTKKKSCRDRNMEELPVSMTSAALSIKQVINDLCVVESTYESLVQEHSSLQQQCHELEEILRLETAELSSLKTEEQGLCITLERLLAIQNWSRNDS